MWLGPLTASLRRSGSDPQQVLRKQSRESRPSRYSDLVRSLDPVGTPPKSAIVSSGDDPHPRSVDEHKDPAPEHIPDPIRKDSRELAIARALIAAYRKVDQRQLSPYSTEYLAGHVARCGEVGWRLLEAETFLLDQLNPTSIAAEAMTQAWGSVQLPSVLAGAVGASHLLANAAFAERQALRQVGSLRFGSPPAPQSASYSGAWSVDAGQLNHHPLHRVLLGHSSWVRAVAASPGIDGDAFIVSGDAEGWMRIWDPVSAVELAPPLLAHAGGVYALQSLQLPNGMPVIASAGADQLVRIWDPVTWEQTLHPMDGHSSSIWALHAFVTDKGEPRLVSGSWDRSAIVWNPEQGDLICRYSGHTSGVNAVTSLEAQGTGAPLIASAADDGSIHFWSPETGERRCEPLHTPKGGINAVRSITLPNGSVLVIAAGWDGVVRCWDARGVTASPAEISEHSGWIRAVDCIATEEGPVIVSTGDDTSIQLSAVEGRFASPRHLLGHTGRVRALTQMPRDSDLSPLIVSGADDGTVRIWDPSLADHGFIPASRALSGVRALAGAKLQRMNIIATGLDDGRIRFWDPETRTQCAETILASTGGIRALAFLVHGERLRLASAGDDSTIRIWDVESGAQLGTDMTGHSGWINGLSVLPAGAGQSHVCSVGEDGTLRLWDLTRFSEVGHPISAHPGWINCVDTAVTPSGVPVAVTGGNDHAVRIWDLAHARPLRDPLYGHDGWIRAAKILSCGEQFRVVSSGNDTTIRIWDVAKGRTEKAVEAHTSSVRALGVYRVADASFNIASASNDGTIKVWDEMLNPTGVTLSGHRGWVRCIVPITGANGERLLVSGSDDGATRVWSADQAATRRGYALGERPARGRAIAPLVGGRGAFATISPAGRLVLCSADPTFVQVHGGGALSCTTVSCFGTAEEDVRRLLIGNNVGDISIIDGTTLSPLLTRHAIDGPIGVIETFGSDESNFAAVSGNNGEILFLDCMTLLPALSPLSGHQGRVLAIRIGYVGDDCLCVSSGSDCSLRLWDITKGIEIGRALMEAPVTVLTPLFKLDAGPAVGWGDTEGGVGILSLEDFSQLRNPRSWRHAEQVSAVDLALSSTDKLLIVIGSFDGVLRIVEADSSNILTELDLHEPIEAAHVVEGSVLVSLRDGWISIHPPIDIRENGRVR